MQMIVYANLFPLIALVVLLFLMAKNPLFKAQQNKTFQSAAAICITMLVVISIDYLTQQSTIPGVWIVRHATTFLNFAASPLIPLLLYRIYTERTLPRLLTLPFLLNLAVCALSLFNGIVFRISPQNTYDRGPLFFLPFLISITYLLVLLVHSGTYRKASKHSERLYLLFTIFMLCLSMFLEIALRFRFLSWDCVTVCLILYYMLLNVNNATTDPLTGALNRPMYTQALARLSTDAPFSVAQIDLNGFKLINDQHGHQAGDRFLQQFVHVMQVHLPRGVSFYRVGGDEFAVISRRFSPSELAALLEAGRQLTQQSGIDFSYGIAQWSPGLDLEEVVKLSDQAMYHCKKRLKDAEPSPPQRG